MLRKKFSAMNSASKNFTDFVRTSQTWQIATRKIFGLSKPQNCNQTKKIDLNLKEIFSILFETSLSGCIQNQYRK